MAKKTQDHIHKLKRIKFKTGNSVYFCALDCNFKIAVPLSLGKRSLCWRCGEPFNMNEYSIRLARPHCEKCHKSKDSVEQQEDYKLTDEHGDEAKFKGVGVQPQMSLADRLTQALNASKTVQPLTEDEEI